MKFYVYELRDETGKVFYVGKGSGPRMYAHKGRAIGGEKSHRSAKIRQILARGGTVYPVTVFSTDDEQAAFAEECRLIAFYGRENLTNKTDGGDGPSNPAQEVRDRIAAGRRGYKASAETRQKQRERKLGTHRSDETRAKISASQRGKKCPWARELALRNLAKIPSAKGRKHKPESIEKMKKSKLGHPVSEETRKKISRTRKGTQAWNKGLSTPEAVKLKISATKRRTKTNV